MILTKKIDFEEFLTLNPYTEFTFFYLVVIIR